MLNTNSRDSVSKTDDRIDELADQISNLFEIVNKHVITPASAKAVEKTCVTCGGRCRVICCYSMVGSCCLFLRDEWTLIVVFNQGIIETGMIRSDEKASGKAERSKGIDLLSEASLLEEAQGDSGDEANIQGNDEDVHESNDDTQQADDERTDSEYHETNDGEEETNNEFIHTPPAYVPTNDEAKDETKGVDKEDTGNTNEPPVVNVDSKDWFKKPKRPPTPDPE
nr:hypothetical protein [Tanacetum cinerariifolium]